jgi:hypothetical protein
MPMARKRTNAGTPSRPDALLANTLTSNRTATTSNTRSITMMRDYHKNDGEKLRKQVAERGDVETKESNVTTRQHNNWTNQQTG